METSLFSFDLPPELIAQEPAQNRENARLLILDRSTGSTHHVFVRDVPAAIEPGTLLVLNDTRVRKARLFARTEEGRRVEVLLLARRTQDRWETLTGRVGKLRAPKTLFFSDGVSGSVESAENDVRLIRFTPPIDDAWLEKNGHVPLPPYVKREDTPADEERYQTVYSRIPALPQRRRPGFTSRRICWNRSPGKGVQIAWVTLHVGLGTFLPIRAQRIEDHTMHEEEFSIPPQTKELVDAAKREGRPVLAVGTTVVRTLESAWKEDGLTEGDGRTRIYIAPGFAFRVVSRLFTNFHTPESSLLVLVSAFRRARADPEDVRGGDREAVPVFFLWRCNVDTVATFNRCAGPFSGSLRGLFPVWQAGRR